ncbi:hypothetical protein CBR_g22329 [Chara braunii]|uniref:Uncharacterized protein n=1 Tax=Chara braunii TaxID=69332 RepID=A0A388JUY9_CHABU|nr:hypothetical protein CBR_g22329 [Chara braunii]|eukprot:GBG61532.1 hypothetical protein CBR_g22329 [Chara braunii]
MWLGSTIPAVARDRFAVSIGLPAGANASALGSGFKLGDGSVLQEMPFNHSCIAEMMQAASHCYNKPNKTEDCYEACNATSTLLYDCLRIRSDEVSNNVSSWPVLYICGDGANRTAGLQWEVPANHPCFVSIVRVGPVCRDITKPEDCSEACKEASREVRNCVRRRTDQVSTDVKAAPMVLTCSAASAVRLSGTRITIAALILILSLLLHSSS